MLGTVSNPDLVMETDGSREGWGAVCQGVQTGGLYSKMEQKFHIYCLELLARCLAVKSFTKGKLCVLCEPSKGDPLPRSFQPVPSCLGMVFGSKYFSEGRRPLAVQILQRFEQLAVVRAQRCFAL